MSDIKDHVVIPVKPLAVTVANGVALTAAAVATAGTAAAALIAGGVVVTGAAVKGASKAKKAAARRSSTSAARKTAASSAGGKRAAGKSGASSSGSGGGKAAGRSLLSRMTKGKGPASKAAVSKSAAAGPSSRGSTSTGSGKRSTSGASKSPLSRGAQWATRQAASAARRATEGAKGAARRAAADAKGGSAATDSITRNLRRAAFARARGWVQRNVMGRKTAPKRTSGAVEKNVTPTVKRAPVSGEVTTGIIGPLAPGAIIAGSMPQYLTSNAPYSTTHSAGGNMKHYAGQMADYAAEYDAPGVLEIIDELDANLYDSLKLVAEAVDLLSQKARNKWPFDQAIGQKLSMTSECLWAAAGMARDVVTDIESIHGDELRKLRNPDRPGMEKFDLAANGKA